MNFLYRLLKYRSREKPVPRFKGPSASASVLERPTTNISEFVQRAPTGSAYCRIKNTQLNRLYISLAARMVEPGKPDEVTQLLDENLSSICPRCGTWLTGKALGLAGKKQGLKGPERKSGVGRGTMRVVNGYCFNEKCSCNEMVICWRIEEDHRVSGLSHRKAARVLGLVQPVGNRS